MSFGSTLGRGAGKLAAVTVHGVIRTAEAAGDFGVDFIAGAESGYDERSEELRIKRELAKVQMDAKRAAAKAAAEAKMATLTATEPLAVSIAATVAPTKRAVKA